MTPQGIGRRAGDSLDILDTRFADLHEAVVAGSLDELRNAPTTHATPIAATEFLAPVRPRRLGQVGLNYRSHLEEIGAPEPEQMIFGISDCSDALTDPGAVIDLPADAPDHVDHECELAFVLGAEATNVAAADAWGVIAGVTACNDVSARDVQRAGIAQGDRGAGKMLPGFKPLGPGLITTDSVVDRAIEISLTVNGVEHQRATSDEMIFGVPEIVEALSATETLRPGDVIITGSPAGVGAFAGRFLRDGDVVEVSVDDMPPLRNTFRR